MQSRRVDFWKFFTGQTISVLGSAFSGFALPLLVFQLTHSPISLAITTFTYALPHLLFGLFIGAWVDRVDRKRLMITVDVLLALVMSRCIQASTGMVSAFSGAPTRWGGTVSP